MFGCSTREAIGLALAAGAIYVVAGLIFAVRRALIRSREAATMTEGDPARCPHCGFRYAFDGHRCGHCWRRAHDSRFLWTIVFWPSDLWRRATRRIRQIVADRNAEPDNSHPGTIVPPGTPLANAMRDSRLRGDSSLPKRGLARDGKLEKRSETEAKDASNLAVSMQGNASVRVIADILHDTFQQIQDVMDAKRQLAGTPSGLHALDELLCGLGRGELFVVAGRPSMGKTSFALSVLQNVALGHSQSVLLFSPGMTGEQISQAMLCSHACVDSTLLRSGRLSEEQFQKLVMAAGAFHEARIFIDDSPDLTLAELSEKARMMAETEKLALLIVDDLDHLREASGTPMEASHSRNDTSSQLKRLARELNVPILVASQIHRRAEGRKHCRPCLSDLRGLQSLEEAADVVMLLYRDDYYDPESVAKGICEVIVAKNRMGPTGVVEVAFLREFTRFDNLARRVDAGS